MKKLFANKLTLLIIAVTLSVIVIVCAVFAWFAFTPNVDAGGISLNVGREDENISIEEIHGIQAGSVYMLTPGKIIAMKLSMDAACTNFGVKLDLTIGDFNTVFATRTDLMTSVYGKAKTITTAGGNQYVYEHFNVDKYLADEFSLNATQIATQRQAFFKRFRDECSIFDVLQIRIIEIDGVAADIPLSAIDNIFYATPAMSFTAGQSVEIEIYYANEDYVPTITYLTTDTGANYFAPTADTVYVMNNYNCFLGYDIKISFVTA